MKKQYILFFLLLTLITACAETPTPTTVAPPDAPAPATPAPTTMPDTLARTPGRIVISELVPGVPGNNNYEFIELYNAGTEAVNLKGWSLWYKMLDSKDAERVAIWTMRTDVPGYGHYLLARTGEDVGTVVDMRVDVPLFERKGGLVLKNAAGDIVDSLGWGDAPAEFVQDAPAPAPVAGAALERAPGGPAGNGTDTDDSSADFLAQSAPNPQNRGAAITPLPDKALSIRLNMPESVTPGTEFPLDVRVENTTGAPVNLATVVVPIPEGFVMVAVPDAVAPPLAAELDSPVEISLPYLDAGASAVWTLTLRSPWNYNAVYFGGAYIETPDLPLRAYAALTPIAIEGGAIPIGTARTLEGHVVTVEGVATMYTGGFYAGGTGTKFYLEDGTGGIQAYCPGAKDLVSVRVGDRVRVTGLIEAYRDSLEIIPEVYPDHVEILEKATRETSPPAPLPITGQAANSDYAILGLLTQVEGQVMRFEEFGYSYELDLADETGYTTLVYVEKETGMNPEFVDVGKLYRITGISELYSTQWQLKPRTSADFVEVFPPELMLEVTAQNSVVAGNVITYTITAYNHTAAPLTAVRITATPPPTAAAADVQDAGTRDGAGIVWVVERLEPAGGSVAVHFTVNVSAAATDPIELPGARATAAEWPEPVQTPPWLTFVGTGVPIWAIQGTGARSPFVRSAATTEGVVTGVFPDLGGLWLQSLEPDADPATSEGVFVLVDAAVTQTVALGDHVLATGRVRETSGQTLLHVTAPDGLAVLASGLPLPAAVELDPPQDSAAARTYFEALEGMLVSITAPAVAVAPTSKYGEYALVRPRWDVARVFKGEAKGMLLFVDDGSAVTHSDQATLPYAVQVGDQVGGLIGPLAFTFENYKVLPIVTPTVTTVAVPLPQLAEAGANEFSLATFNVENLFDIVDPHPSDPPKPKPDEYRLKLAKTANTILAMGVPTVIGFQEVENVGILADLAADPVLAAYGYVPALMEGFDSRGIDVGYLVRGDVATLESVSQHTAPEGLTSRPPLMITVTVHLDSGDQTVVVLNNHFTSMGGGEAATEPRRTAQAEWNVTLVRQILAQTPDALVAVLGDLNSYYHSRPLDALRESGLRHVYEAANASELLYTYIYQGESETLDHILVTPTLYERVVRVAALHVNADYPPAVPEAVSPRRTSDHDPLVVVFGVE